MCGLKGCKKTFGRCFVCIHTHLGSDVGGGGGFGYLHGVGSDAGGDVGDAGGGVGYDGDAGDGVGYDGGWPVLMVVMVALLQAGEGGVVNDDDDAGVGNADAALINHTVGAGNSSNSSGERCFWRCVIN